MKKIKQIISVYRKYEANSILLKEIFILNTIFLFFYLFCVLIEQIFYLVPISREKIFNLYFSTLLISLTYVFLKWFIAYKKLFNNNNHYILAKKIGDRYKAIKDNLLNVLQINNNKHNDNDLKKYAIKQLEEKLEKNLLPKIKLYFPRKQFLAFIISIITAVLLFVSTEIKLASNRLIHYNQEFSPPLPFILTSLSGSFSALSGDTLDLSISGIGDLPDSIHINWLSNNNNNKQLIMHDKEIYQMTIPNVTNDIIYWAEYKSKAFFSAWDKIVTIPDSISIKQRPVIKNISFNITPPIYTNLKSYIHNQTNNNQIEILQGSNISLNAMSNKNLSKAWLLDKEERIDLRITANKIYGKINFMDNMYFSIYCLDNALIANKNPIQYSFIIKNDIPPNIVVQSPKLEFELNESFLIPLKVNIYDDYGIDNVWIDYKIISPEFPELNKQIKKFDLNSDTIVGLDTYINYDWDISNINILMGDEIHFWVVAEDKNNITGPGITKSAKIIGRFPSIENLFSRIEEYENNTEDITEDIYDSIDEISEIAKEVRLELLKTDELTWEQEKKLEKTFDEVDEVFKALEKIQENMDKVMEQTSDNNLFDNELMDKFSHFQDMLQAMMSDELMDAIAELQEALQNMDPKKILDSLKNYEFNIEKFEEELDRFIDMFEMALAEQKLNELSEHIENMINKQKDMIEEIENNQDEYVLEKKSSKQENRFSSFEDLLKETKNSISEISKDVSEQIEQLSNNNLTKETKDILSKQTDNVRNQDEELDQNSKIAKEKLEEISNTINMISEQFKNENIYKMTKEFIIIIDNLITMSNQQEKIILATKDIRSNNPKLREINQNQNNIDRELNQVTKQLIELSNQTFFVTPKINRAIGKLKNSIASTVTLLEQKKINTVRKKQQDILKNINEITFLLLLSMEEMQNSNSASGFEQFMQSLEDMSMQQEGLNQATMQIPQLGIGQQQSILDELMKQQQALKDKLGELLKEMAGEETGGLSKAQNEMEDVIDDFERGNVNQKTFERQQRILSKMLDSQKSLTKKDFSEKRQNKIAKTNNYLDPGSISNNLGEKDLLLINAMESAINEGLSSEYQKLIRLYFLNLQKENNENE